MKGGSNHLVDRDSLITNKLASFLIVFISFLTYNCVLKSKKTKVYRLTCMNIIFEITLLHPSSVLMSVYNHSYSVLCQRSSLTSACYHTLVEYVEGRSHGT